MATLPLDSFGGISPLIHPRKLPDLGAVLARDCVFDGTDLRPLREPVFQASLGFEAGRLHKYVYNGQSYWLAWPRSYEVDVARSPIAQDQLGRLYWTRYNSNATGDGDDGYPRVASQPTQSAISSNSSSIRRLGIPQPANACTISEVQVAASIAPVTISQTSPATVTTASAHPFKDGQRVSVLFATVPTPPEGDSYANMSELVGNEYIVANSQANQFDLRGADASNFTEFTDPTGVTIERVYLDADMETRSYVYTFVSDWGEEGGPSTPTTPSDVRYDSTIEVTCPADAATPFSTYINRIRVYRTASGSTGAQFFFVGEAAIPIAGHPVVFSDDVQPIGLGEELPSATWQMPPNHLQGLTALPNGILAGFKGNTVYFCEPYLPHAWPNEYTKTTQDDIVGMAVFGQTLVIATKGKPYAATGTDSASMSMSQLDVYAPCISKGGVISVGVGVAFPTYDGMALIPSSNPNPIITYDYVSKRNWADLWDSSMQAVFHDTRYIAFSSQANKTLTMQIHGGRLNIATANLPGSAPAVDPVDDSMHYCASENRVMFDAGDAILANWQSRIWTLPQACSLGIGQVFASGYPVTLEIGYANLDPSSAQPTADISGSYTVVVVGPEPFRLPATFMSREWQVTIKTLYDVQRAILAEVPDEIR
jgi:hypothetical protein